MRNILMGHRAERDTLASGDYVAREEPEFPVNAAAGTLQCRLLTVLTWDEEGEENSADVPIRLIPAWKWLLGECYDETKNRQHRIRLDNH